MGTTTAHWHEDMSGNVVALACGLVALLIAFQPNISVFSPLGLGAAQDVCSASPACQDLRVEGPSSMFDMQWTIWAEPSGEGTLADRQALRDNVLRAAVRDPARASVILGKMPAKSKKGA